ncbi:2-hydroxy-6-oxononadienedioate/2-hydroxy-6-oxononatrienedioate hydrolase [Acrasis kona]|uniref:2-hydroxy-6-oxononadienedioate/2-hydroxy-6-oxononatrienedioate hydrolase n=1 Tax=Acrasis kona TaxID=1008807 RepID=A0AAW2ZPL6_9EUKA
MTTETKDKIVGETVQLSDGKTRYILEGDVDNEKAPVLVCLHGLSGGVFVWELFAREMVKRGGYKILRYDEYGNGFSDAVTSKHEPELFVRQLAELIDHLKLPKVNLLGHSLGGAVSILYANKHPDKVENLILLSPAGMKWVLYGTGFIKVFPGMSAFFFEQFLRAYSMERAVPSTFFDPKYSKEGVEIYVDSIKEAGLRHFADGTTKTLKDFPFAEGIVDQVKEFGQKDIKIMILWGEFDTTVQPDVLLPKWLEVLPNAKYYSIKYCRHDFMTEEPAMCGKLITSFIQGEEISAPEVCKLRENKDAEFVELTSGDKKIKAFWESKQEYQDMLL